MPHISKKKLGVEAERRLRKDLLAILVRRGSSRGRAELLQELLTETEMRMLEKRLSLIFMLEDERSYYQISRALGMSTSTIKRFHTSLLSGHYKALRKTVALLRTNEEFLDILETILRAGMPPRGRGRWSFLRT